MTDHSSNSADAQATTDPAQLIPPRVDTAPELVAGLTFADLKAYTPAATGFLAAGGGVATGNLPLAAAGVAGGLGLGAAGVGMQLTDRWYTSSRERLTAWYASVARQYRDDTAETLPDCSGVDDVTEQGFLQLADGRFVAIVPVEPRNTALLDADQRNTLAASLSSVVDEQLTDLPFRLYSTTRETDVDDVAARYERRAMNPTTADAQASVLLDVADWLRDADAPNWDARTWQHYVVVDADAMAVTGLDEPSVLDFLNPLSDADAVPDDAIQAALADRVGRVRDAIQSISGLDTREPTPAEALSVTRGFWGRRDDLPSALVDEVVAGDAPVDRVVEPESWEPHRGWVAVGDEYAKTLWLAEYPTEPASLWLKDLTTLRGVDVDLCVNVSPVDLDDGIHRVSKQVADIGSEGEFRAEEQDIAAMDTDSAGAATRKMRELLAETPSQPWDVSVYIVIRASDRDALDAAADDLASFQDVDGAKRGALDTAEQDVRDVLTRAPANTIPVAPASAQAMAFRAASPVTRDVWDAETPVDKRRLVPGAVIGSMFPFAAIDRREPTGMDWGRNEETGTHLRLSPFERGGAPHMLTIGQSRSGKTYSASKAALRWYLERDDRTLIVCDTQQGFDGLTQLCDGAHVVVDGDQSVNPLRIEPSPDHHAEGADEFRMTVEETVGFLVGLLRADDVSDAGTYAPLLSQAAERTLADAGIEAGDPETFANPSPTLDDLLETLVDMNDNPEDYTWSTEGYEVESHKQQVGALLTKLRSFQDAGKFASLVGPDELGLIDDDVDMAYLDLHALSDSGDAEKSAMLQLLLGQVREKIKQTDGEVVFMLDEAHVLLDSKRTADWLQKATREFARHQACLWFLSQSPSDFVSGDAESDARDTIRAQCSTIHFFRTPRVSADVLEQFGLNATQREFVQQKAVRGKEGRGYSECLVDFEDVEGWLPCYVESAPLEDRALTYSRRDDGGHGTRREDFERYLTGASGDETPGERPHAAPADDAAVATDGGDAE